MALQIWLPLVRDTNNQGLDDITITNGWSGKGSIVDNGKLGKCLKTTTTTITTNYIPNFNNNSYSIGGWFKFNKAEIQTVIDTLTVTSTATTAGGCLLGNTSFGGLGINWSSNNLNTSGKVLDYLLIFGSLRTSTASTNTTSNFTIPFDTWTHIFLIWDLKNSQLKLFKNGVLYSTKNVNSFSDGVLRSFAINYNGTYAGNGPSTSIPFGTNDIRLYDHALSEKEVELLSRGLVAHYPLNDKYCTSNLIINGFGENGQENWINSNYSTTDIPSDQTTIKASYYNNTTKEFIPININHSYTISCYMKARNATSGTVYPSVLPYDIDKKFINNYNTGAGFNSTYKTTLAQPLKKGDTVVYATNLSAWTTGDNYYCYVAVFSYKDSQGYIYPDMIYTQDSLVFGTKTDKSNINKTNNTITLNAPFAGEDRPAGTTICQATAGSTYYYPFGGIDVSTIQDWTFKTKTFIPVNIDRLKAMKYMYWNAYGSTAFYAGNKLIDNSDINDGTIYDVSGFNYHGIINGELNCSLKTARHNYSTIFNGTNNAIKIPFNNMLGITASSKTEYSMSCWIYVSDFGSKSWATIFGGPSGFEIETKNGSNATPAFYAYSWGKGNVSYSLNTWHHIAMTENTSETKWYLDGELAFTGTSANIPVGNYFIGSWSTATGQNFKGYVSDFRIYATALSADAIKDLYQTSASIDKNGNLLTYEFKED